MASTRVHNNNISRECGIQSSKSKFIREDQRGWKVCVEMVTNAFAFAIGSLFAKEKVLPETKEQVMEMVTNIKSQSQLQTMINESEWLEEKTKSYALKKVEQVAPLIGYPDFLLSSDNIDLIYSNLTITKEHWKNVHALNNFNTTQGLTNLSIPLNASHWGRYAITTGAFYSPEYNTIVIPGGLIREPMYHPIANPATNYGRLGYIIGHELVHGFDYSSTQYGLDGDGKQFNWWGESSLTEFRKLASCLERQYGFYAHAGCYVDGNATLSENIADNSGLKAAYKAFKDHPNEILPGIPYFGSTDQMFFTSFAQSLCSKERNDKVRRVLMQVDPHAPAPIRVNGALANMPEFAQAFRCKAGSAMNPTHRCNVW